MFLSRSMDERKELVELVWILPPPQERLSSICVKGNLGVRRFFWGELDPGDLKSPTSPHLLSRLWP